VFPGADWETTDATAAGFDQAALDAIAARAEGGGSNCFLVTRGGKIVDERYWNGKTPAPGGLATKSHSSTLVGIAQAEGKLKVTDKASQYIPEWVGTPSEDVTIENLLKNDSGRHWDFKTDYTDMAVGAKDKTAFAIGLGQDAAPGTVWAYNNRPSRPSAILKKPRHGGRRLRPAEAARPIGMTNSKIRRMPPAARSPSWACSRPAAHGAWPPHAREGHRDGTQVVPRPGSMPPPAVPPRAERGYGYLWWLNRSTVASRSSRPPVRPGRPGGRPDGARRRGHVLGARPGRSDHRA
jgi:CubicO group peptidase (beta-lactamase class C family)